MISLEENADNRKNGQKEWKCSYFGGKLSGLSLLEENDRLLSIIVTLGSKEPTSPWQI